MKNLFFIFLCITWVFFGCNKDYISSTSTFIKNESSVGVKITLYLNGQTYDDEIKIINPGERIEVFEDHPYGKTLQPSWPTLMLFYDSINVVFDNNPLVKIRHLVFSDTLNCNKCLPFSNNRNITNEQNYTKTIEKEHRKYLKGYFEFTITEDDYNYAKD